MYNIYSMEKSSRVSNTYALASTLNYMRFSPENLLVHSKREGSQLGDRESAQKIKIVVLYLDPC